MKRIDESLEVRTIWLLLMVSDISIFGIWALNTYMVFGRIVIWCRPLSL